MTKIVVGQQLKMLITIIVSASLIIGEIDNGRKKREVDEKENFREDFKF